MATVHNTQLLNVNQISRKPIKYNANQTSNKTEFDEFLK